MHASNILWIMADQHKATALSCLGERALKRDITPNLDRLSEDGILFTGAYCPSPVCGPARASMKTGKYPPATGMVKNLRPLRVENQYLPALLRNAGYQTGMAGKLHLAPADRDFGFEVRHLSDAPYSVYGNEDKYSEYIAWLRKNYFSKREIDPVEIFDRDELAYEENLKLFMMGSCFRTEKEHETAWTTDMTIDFLEKRDTGKPFFFYTSYFGPHQPYGVPEPYASYYSPEDIELPETFYQELQNSPSLFREYCTALYHHVRSSLSRQDCKELIAAYLNQTRMIDAYIGKIIEYLKKTKLYDKTIIIYTSDHGENLGEHGLFFKSQMYDSCARVPLIIKPAYPCAVHRREEIVNTIDLFSTVLDVAGIDEKKVLLADSNIESRSLNPLFAPGAVCWKNETYSIVGADKDKALCMIRSGKWKLIRLAQGPKEALYELYNIEQDHEEKYDLYSCPEYKETAGKLKEKLDKWFGRQYSNY